MPDTLADYLRYNSIGTPGAPVSPPPPDYVRAPRRGRMLPMPLPPLPSEALSTPTLTGQENYSPPVEGPTLRPEAVAMAAFDPFGLASSAPRVAYNIPVETLTGEDQGLGARVTDGAPRPSSEEQLAGALGTPWGTFLRGGQRAMDAISRGVNAAPRVAGGVAATAAVTGASDAASPKRNPEREAIQQTIEDTDTTLKALRRQINEQRAIAEAHPRDQVQSNRARAAEQVAKLQQQYNERLSELTRSQLPFDQAFPWLAQNRAALGIAAPMVAGGIARNLGNLHARAGNAGWRRAVDTAERNMTGSTPAQQRAFQYNARVAENALRNQLPPTVGAIVDSGRTFTRNTLYPGMAGGFVGGELAALPHQHNRVNAPPGSQPRKLAEDALSSENLLGTLWPGVAMGVAGGLTGSHIIPSFGPGHRPVAQSQALSEMLRRGDMPTSLGAPPSPASPQGGLSGGGAPGGGQLSPATTAAPALPAASSGGQRGRLIDNARAGQQALGLAPEELLRVPPLPNPGQPRLPAPSPSQDLAGYLRSSAGNSNRDPRHGLPSGYREDDTLRGPGIRGPGGRISSDPRRKRQNSDEPQD